MIKNSIAIGINIFGSFHRQDLCIASLERIKKCMLTSVELYNIQQLGLPETIHPSFTTIYDKGRTASNTVPGSTNNLPMVRDMFDALADLNKDYFIFLNSDIILTTQLIKTVLYDNFYDALSGSRLAIEHIDTLDTSNITHSHFQIAGFDVFLIRTDWWKKNRHLFPDYVYAVSAWDVDYACRLNVLTPCSRFENEMPATCYHIMHEEKSHNDTPERRHNMKIFFEDSKPLCDAWHSYLYKVLALRTPLNCNYTEAALGERSLEREHFNNEHIYSFCSNWR